MTPIIPTVQGTFASLSDELLAEIVYHLSEDRLGRWTTNFDQTTHPRTDYRDIRNLSLVSKRCRLASAKTVFFVLYVSIHHGKDHFTDARAQWMDDPSLLSMMVLRRLGDTLSEAAYMRHNARLLVISPGHDTKGCFHLHTTFLRQVLSLLPRIEHLKLEDCAIGMPMFRAEQPMLLKLPSLTIERKKYPRHPNYGRTALSATLSLFSEVGRLRVNYESGSYREDFRVPYLARPLRVASLIIACPYPHVNVYLMDSLSRCVDLSGVHNMSTPVEAPDDYAMTRLSAIIDGATNMKTLSLDYPLAILPADDPFFEDVSLDLSKAHALEQLRITADRRYPNWNTIMQTIASAAPTGVRSIELWIDGLGMDLPFLEYPRIDQSQHWSSVVRLLRDEFKNLERFSIRCQCYRDGWNVGVMEEAKQRVEQYAKGNARAARLVKFSVYATPMYVVQTPWSTEE